MGKKKAPDWTGMKGVGVGQCRWRLGSSGIEFCEQELALRRDNVLLAAEPKSLYVLTALLRHPQTLVLKKDLARWIWHGRPNTDAVVAKAVTKLRTALGDSDQALIVTAHGRGYVLAVTPECIAANPE